MRIGSFKPTAREKFFPPFVWRTVMATRTFSAMSRLIIFLSLLIVLSGDVESNPGPPKEQGRGRSTPVQTRSTSGTIRDYTVNRPGIQANVNSYNSPSQSNRTYNYPSANDVSQGNYYSGGDISSTLAEICQDMKNLRNIPEKIDALDRKLDGVLDEMCSLREENQALKTRLMDTERKLDYLENQSRRNNVIIHGIADESKESWDDTEEKATDFIRNKLGMDDTPDIERAHRLGRFRPGHSRPVIMKLLNYKHVEMILKRARDTLKRSGNQGDDLHSTNYRVTRDYSARVKNIRMKLWETLDNMRKSGDISATEGYISYDKLIVGRDMYVYDDMDDCVKLKSNGKHGRK